MKNDDPRSLSHSLDALLRLAATELKPGHHLAIHAGEGEITVRLWVPRRDYAEWPQNEHLSITEQVAFILKAEGVLLTERVGD